jgi:hypothetical protein
MNTERSTPETNAEISHLSKAVWGDKVPADFARKLERERDNLTKWKEEQMFIESQWDAQAVAKELGMVVGADIRRNILPSIVRLKQERDEARAEIERMNLLASSVAGIVAKQQAMAETIKEAVGLLGLYRHFLRSVNGDTANCDSTLAKLKHFLK